MMGDSFNIDNTPSPPPRSRWRTNIALLVTATLIVVGIGEGLFRYRYGPGGYHPPQSVLRIQEHLVTHPEYGFAWRPNVREDDDIVFGIADVDFRPLSTDANGFINHPDATANRAVDILGIGDSFVEHAAHTWFELAKERGLTYHSIALHRTAPPQYARIFETHGIAKKPKWVVIGLFENDFTETSDFQQWRESDLDWFRYHSGTWCGPPVDDSMRAKLRDGILHGWNAAYTNIRANVRGGRMTISGPSDSEIEGVIEALRDILARTRSTETRALIVLIPSKPTALKTTTNEAEAYDTVITALNEDGPVDVLDLRQAFRHHSDPPSLYYEVDGHWNGTGMKFAGQLIFDYLRRAESNP